MSKLRVAFNGFGRIGRLTFRELIKNENVEIVAINNRSTPEQTALQLRYDSVHGKFPGNVGFDDEHLIVNEYYIKKLQFKDPKDGPWGAMGVDIVVECTGVFVKREDCQGHIEAGAKKVLLSAPAKGKEPVKTIVMGVNEHELDPKERIISNASCTTNCFAPIAKVLSDNYGIDKGYMVTVHAYTADQQLVDNKHKDPRRARAAAVNIIPTSSGAAIAVEEVIPNLKGKLHAEAVRVPVPCGSMTYFTADLCKEVSAQEINTLFYNVAKNHMQGILEFSSDPLVSSDILGNPHSCIFDSQLTSTDGRMVKLVAWYDNEWGYSNRMVDLILLLGKTLQTA